MSELRGGEWVSFSEWKAYVGGKGVIYGKGRELRERNKGTGE